MQRLQKYFGFRADLTNDLDPVRLEALEERAAKLSLLHNLDPQEYYLYLHVLRLWAEDSHFGVSGGLSQRVKSLELTFSVNPRQRKSGDIKFLNFEVESSLPPHVKVISHPHEVTFRIDGEYFDSQLSFSNELITFVRKSVRLDHRKIKASVWAEPTPAFAAKLQIASLKVHSKFDQYLVKPLTLRAPALRSFSTPQEEASPAAPRTRIFISYSHRDEPPWLERLLMYLRPLERDGSGALDIWSDNKIAVGTDWSQEIQKALGSAAVAILLVSPGFLASDFIAKHELPRLLERAREEGMAIIPVILSSVPQATSAQILRLQTVNPPNKPLDDMTKGKRGKYLARIVDEVAAAIARQRK